MLLQQEVSNDFDGARSKVQGNFVFKLIGTLLPELPTVCFNRLLTVVILFSLLIFIDIRNN